MTRRETFFRGLTARDVVRRTGLILSEEMRPRTAAHLLMKRHLRAVPVTDSSGRCVGVLSTVDLLQWNLHERRSGPNRVEPTACVWCDWQVVDVKSPRRDDAVHYLMRDALLVTPDTPLVEIANMLLQPDREPVVVVDNERRPLGVVSSRDILAVLASADQLLEGGSAAEAPTNRRGLLRRAVQTSGRV